MTDEEMAEKYVKQNHCEFCLMADDCESGCIDCFTVQAFLAGLKAGRPKWHKLRENRNDIPPLDKDCERTSIKVVDEYGRIITYDYGSERWRDYEGDSLGLQPDFWCEIPTFTDKE